jgi:acetyl esterase/lipase/CubicO group peptidase (beta-lactamase class C family)
MTDAAPEKASAESGFARQRVFAFWQALRPALRPDVPITQQRAALEALAQPPPDDAVVEPVDATGVPAEWVSVLDAGEHVILYLHGGGFSLGSLAGQREFAARLARATSARVLVLDYRLAPEHPFPAALEDTLAGYRFLLSQGVAPTQIVLVGDSAGGNLVLAALIALRDAGEPLPAGAVTMSPPTDLEGTGASITGRAHLDPAFDADILVACTHQYLAGVDPHSPLASPLYADLTGLPPLLMFVGSAEMLYDDTRRLADRARSTGVEVTVEEGEGLPHIWPRFAMILPEGQRAVEQMAAFTNRHARQPRTASVDRPSALAAPVDGYVAPGFEPVREAFADNFLRRDEVGAQCCVYVAGQVVVDLWGGVADRASGRPYTPDTLQVVASSTKGALAVCMHRLVERGVLDLDAPVARYWPEFAAQSKGTIPVRWLLSHQAGLAAIDQPLTMQQAYEWTPVIEALAAQRPNWMPGSAHGYHAVTFGWLLGEVLRRVSGHTVGTVFRENVADPLGLDWWIGLPASEEGRVAPLILAPMPSPTTPPDPLLARLLDPTGLAFRSVMNPAGGPMAMNDRAFRAAEIPATNGVATARAMARLYAACLGDVDGVRLLRPETVRHATATQVRGEDLVLGYETRYGLGFQLPFPFRPMAGAGSFGHYGMGGSVGFAQPEHKLAFGYAMNRMLSPLGVDPRPAALVEATLRCLS